MRSPHLFQRALGLPALLLPFFAPPLVAAGLENGEVFANNEFMIGGATNLATELIDMKAVAPDPTANPPLPPTFAPATAGILGTMRTLELSATAGINSMFSHASSTGTALVDFVDNLVVNAEGIETGTDLIVEVTWIAGGTTEFTGPARIRNRSKILLEAAGIDLDPDPNAPDPPKQSWTRDVSSFLPEQLDDPGLVSFEFLVQAGTPSPGNIRLRSVAGVLCGGPGSVRTGMYDSGASANLTLQFFRATDVKTTDGQTLYRWSTNAESGLEYGSRDDDPPSDPVLTVTPSEGGPDFVNLSWDTVAGEFYLVQTVTHDENWTTVTEVLGTGSPVEIELFREEPAAVYRLIANFGSGTPDPSLLTPELRVGKEGESVRVAWQTNHWENYALHQINRNGTSTLLEQVSGHGGVVWFDFNPTAPGQVFQVSATLK